MKNSKISCLLFLLSSYLLVIACGKIEALPPDDKTNQIQALNISRENTIAEIPNITIPTGVAGETKTIDLPNVSDKNNIKITPTVAVSGSKVTATINSESDLVVRYVSAGTDAITLTYTSVARTTTEDINNDGIHDNITEISTTKTKNLAVTITAALGSIKITRENTIAEIPTISIYDGSVGRTQSFDLPTIQDKNNVIITPTVAVTGDKVTASITEEKKLLINYVSVGTDTIILTYTSTERTTTDDINNDGIEDMIIETSTTKTKNLPVTVTATAQPLTITRENTITEIPEITINNESVGSTQSFDLPTIQDKNNVIIIPTVAVTGDKVTASITEEQKLLINYVSVGTDTITLTYTSEERTTTEDTNNDGIDDNVTETSTTLAKALSVTVTAVQPLTITRENTIAEIPTISINDGSVGRTQTFDLPTVQDKNNVTITPTVAVTSNKVTASITEEKKLLINYISVGTDTITLTYTSAERTTTEDTNNDGIDDNVTETSTTVTKVLPVTVTATAQSLTISRENTIGEIPAIPNIEGLNGTSKTVLLSVVRDKNNVIITPTVAVKGSFAMVNFNADGNLVVNLVSVGTDTITLTYTSVAVTKTEDSNGDGIDDNVTETSTTKTKDIIVTVNPPEALSIRRINTISIIPTIIIPVGQTGSTNIVTLSEVKDKNNVKITPTVAVTSDKVTTSINDEGNLVVNYVSVGTDTITFTYASVENTKKEDINSDGVDDNVTEISSLKIKRVTVIVYSPGALIVERENTITGVGNDRLNNTESMNNERTLTIPTVRDTRGTILIPRIDVSISTTTVAFNDEGLLVFNNAALGDYSFTLTYTSEAYSIREDTNNDDVVDVINYTSATKVQQFGGNVVPLVKYYTEQNTTTGVGEDKLNESLNINTDRVYVLTKVHDRITSFIDPIITAGESTTTFKINDEGNLEIRSSALGSFSLTLTYTSKRTLLREDITGNGYKDYINYEPVTKVQRIVGVVVQP